MNRLARAISVTLVLRGLATVSAVAAAESEGVSQAQTVWGGWWALVPDGPPALVRLMQSPPPLQPAALALFRPGASGEEAGFAWAATLDRAIARWRRPILAVFTLLAVLGAALLPRLSFDSDPLRTKDPNTEAMRTLADLIANPLTNPYSIDVLAATPAAAEEVVLRADALPRITSRPPRPVAPADCDALPSTITAPDMMFSAQPTPTLPCTRTVASLFMPAQ